MSGVQRVGDANLGGGVILLGEPTVLVNFRPIAVVSSPVSPHPPCGIPYPEPAMHCEAVTTTRMPKILANLVPITTSGTVDTCGHVRLLGSTNVIAGL